MKRLLTVILLLVGISITLSAGEVKDYQKACDDDMAAACKGLGDLYYTGNGVKQDYVEAAKYYGKACDGGYLSGCSTLASMYEMGQGISKDLTKAVTLYTKACKGDDFKGCRHSGMIYKKGLGGTKEEHIGTKAFFRRAIIDGDPRASDIYRELSSIEFYSTEDSEDTNLYDTFDENNFTKVKENGKWGIKDDKGEWLCKPQFDEIVENDYGGSLVYDGGLFLVVHDGKKGIVNTKGKWVIKKYDEILHGQENTIVDINGWVKVKRNGKWGAVNTDGKWIFKPQFDDVESFTVRDQLTVKDNGKWGFIDTKGEWVINPKYDDVGHFSENDVTGFGRILHDGKEGYISDIDGLLMEPVLDRNKNSPSLESIYILNKTGLIAIYGDSGKLGILNKKGKLILKPKFDGVEILEDLIYVQFGAQEGYTTLDGKYLTFTEDEIHIESIKRACETGDANACYDLAHRYDKGQGMKIDKSRSKKLLWKKCRQGDAKSCYSLGAIHAYELSERYNYESSRLYPFVCYETKIKDATGKFIYEECVRSETKCSRIEKSHFGEYPHDLKAHEAFNRCSKGNPKFVESPL